MDSKISSQMAQILYSLNLTFIFKVKTFGILLFLQIFPK